MAKIKDPKSFSDVFDLDKEIFIKEGIFDPILNVDTKLFIDPLLIENSHSEIISKDGREQYKKHFEYIVKLLKKTKKENDTAWKAAENLLAIEEAQGTCLGYGVGSTNGRRLPKKILLIIVETAKEIIDIGIDDPELFALLPLIQEGIGPDFISDFTTSIIEPQLITFTEQFARKYKIKLSKFEHKKLGEINCIINPIFQIPILLLPSDILCKLPSATDWSGVREAADFNHILRGRVNRLISNIWTRKAKRDKKNFKRELIGDKAQFEELIDIIKSIKPKPYDLLKDEKGLIFWHDWLTKASEEYPLTIDSVEKSRKGIISIIESIIKQFQFLVEKHGLNKLLWNNGKRAPEKVSQMLFYAISYSYCKANDIDISPEIDAGSGLIDFKFSHGFHKRIIVELKLTSNPKLVSGYLKQLEIYKESEETTYGYYVVMNVGSIGQKIKKLIEAEDSKLSEIIIIDSILKPSASKR